MNKSDETVILGAGLSGLVAAVLLAKEGKKVRVIEGAKDIGGDLGFHPSLHGTPLDVDKIAAWTGLDTDCMFTKGNGVQMFIGKQAFPQEPVYLIERSNRPTSIDAYLLKQAKALGVEFEFGHYVKDPKTLPKGSIIATGFHPGMYKAFDRKCHKGEGYSIVEKNDDPGLEGNVYGWIGPYTNDYAYGCVLNGMKYIALFSRFGLPDNSLDQFREHLKATLGWEYDDWNYVRNIPYPWSYKSPPLWIDDYIVTGTVGGIIDPMAGFGIQGAILSGVVAAWAVTDPFRARKELKDLNKHFLVSTLSFEATKNIPFRETFFKTMFTLPELFKPMIGLMGKGIPGLEGNYTYDLLKGYHKGRGIGARVMDIKKIFSP